MDIQYTMKNLSALRRFALCAIFLLGWVFAVQANQILEQKLDQLEDGTQRLEALLELGEFYQNTTPPKAKQYLEEALMLAESLSKKEHLAKAQMLLCQMFTHSKDYGETLDYCNQAVAYYKAKDNKLSLAKTYNAIGIISDINGEKGDALAYLNKAVDLFKLIGDKEGEGESYLNIGVCYSQVADYATALDYYLKGFKIFESTNNEKGIKKTNINLGFLNYHQENYQKSEFHFGEALKISRKLSAPSWEAIALEGLAKCNKAKGDKSKALEYANELVDVAGKIGSQYSLASAYWVIGTVKMSRKEHSEASESLIKSLQITDQLNKKQKIDILLNLVAENYLMAGNAGAALPYLERANAMAMKHSHKKVLAENRRLYAVYYEQNQQYKKALEAHKKYKVLHDSVFNVEGTNLQFQLEKSYQEGKNEMEIELLSNTIAFKESRLKFAKSLMIAFGIIFLLVSAFAIKLFNDRKDKRRLNVILEEKIEKRTQELSTSNQKLENSNKELERFAYIASHDLKEPLRSISSFVNLIERKISKKDYSGLEEYIGFVKDGSRMMNNLINDVLSYSKISDKKTELEWVNTNNIMILTKYNLEKKIQERPTEIHVDDLPEIYATKSEIIRLFQNLIGNGLKYNKSEKREMKISYTTKDQYYIFSFEDNGIGIDKPYQGQVFEMFRRLHSRGQYEGTGIGLAACKKIVEKYGGQIWLESEEGKGSCFYVSFPIVSKKEVEKNQQLAEAL